MGRKNRDFWESGLKNNATFIQYFNRLTELSISMFEWKGLPDTIDPRFLELCLFEYGRCVFFKDDVIGYLALPMSSYSTLDVYGYPKRRRAYSSYNSYTSPDLSDDDSVIIWNNYLRKGSKLDVLMFSQRLYDLDRSIDVNAKAQKTPILIVCDDSERLTMENLYMEYDGNKPVIKGTKGLSQIPFTVLKTDAPYVADKLYTLKTQYWNEALTYLGISNINIQKKERLITDEVVRNQGGTVASRYSRLEMRRNACKQINKLFPELNIECNYREDFQNTEIENESLDGDVE